MAWWLGSNVAFWTGVVLPGDRGGLKVQLPAASEISSYMPLGIRNFLDVFNRK